MKTRTMHAAGLVTLLALGACDRGAQAERAPSKPQPEEPSGPKGSSPTESTMKLVSQSFTHKAEIPKKHTCEGADVSPALGWQGVPEAAKSLVLIVDDPDAPDPAAPKRTWVHWVVYDLSPSTSGLPEGVRQLPAGAREGLNDWKATGYRGPCPPIGRHRYFHKLYALDKALGDLSKPNKSQLEAAMQGHVLAKAELIGTYQKAK